MFRLQVKSVKTIEDGGPDYPSDNCASFHFEIFPSVGNEDEDGPLPGQVHRPLAELRVNDTLYCRYNAEQRDKARPICAYVTLSDDVGGQVGQGMFDLEKVVLDVEREVKHFASFFLMSRKGEKVAFVELYATYLPQGVKGGRLIERDDPLASSSIHSIESSRSSKSSSSSGTSASSATSSSSSSNSSSSSGSSSSSSSSGASSSSSSSSSSGTSNSSSSSSSSGTSNSSSSSSSSGTSSSSSGTSSSSSCNASLSSSSESLLEKAIESKIEAADAVQVDQDDGASMKTDNSSEEGEDDDGPTHVYETDNSSERDGDDDDQEIDELTKGYITDNSSEENSDDDGPTKVYETDNSSEADADDDNNIVEETSHIQIDVEQEKEQEDDDEEEMSSYYDTDNNSEAAEDDIRENQLVLGVKESVSHKEEDLDQDDEHEDEEEEYSEVFNDNNNNTKEDEPEQDTDDEQYTDVDQEERLDALSEEDDAEEPETKTTLYTASLATKTSIHVWHALYGNQRRYYDEVAEEKTERKQLKRKEKTLKLTGKETKNEKPVRTGNNQRRRQERDDGSRQDFLRRMDEIGDRRNQRLSEQKAKQEYEESTRKKECPQCGREQSYDQVKKRQKKCMECKVPFRYPVVWTSDMRDSFLKRNSTNEQRKMDQTNVPSKPTKASEAFLARMEAAAERKARRRMEGESKQNETFKSSYKPWQNGDPRMNYTLYKSGKANVLPVDTDDKVIQKKEGTVMRPVNHDAQLWRAQVLVSNHLFGERQHNNKK